MRNKYKLIIEQLDSKLNPFIDTKNIQVPERGWIHTIRTALNMTLQQLGKKLDIKAPSVKDAEEREVSGSITLKSLKEVGDAMDMQLVYALVPKQKSIDELVISKSHDLAKKIVLRTGHNMKLENQGISDNKIKDAIEELADEIKREMRKTLWD